MSGDGLGQLGDDRGNVAHDICRRRCVLEPKNIDIVQTFYVAPKSALQRFRHFEIQQQLAGQFFGDFIAGDRNHAIADY